MNSSKIARISYLLLALLVILSPLAVCAWGAPAKSNSDSRSQVLRVLDADTYLVKKDNGDVVKERLHFADSPEIAHNSKEIDQPFGVDAAAYANRLLSNHEVIIHHVDQSYDREVSDVTVSGVDVALKLVSSGYAMLDPRFHPTKVLIDAQDAAKKAKRGIWSAPNPIPPWQWRKEKLAKKPA
jgi:endonuclease YncB( thermonuclease family)